MPSGHKCHVELAQGDLPSFRFGSGRQEPGSSADKTRLLLAYVRCISLWRLKTTDNLGFPASSMVFFFQFLFIDCGFLWFFQFPYYFLIDCGFLWFLAIFLWIPPRNQPKNWQLPGANTMRRSVSLGEGLDSEGDLCAVILLRLAATWGWCLIHWTRIYEI